MRSVLFHCKDFGTVITGLSTRPDDIVHADILDKEQSSHDCIVPLVTVEKGDTLDKGTELVDEILKFCSDTGHRRVFLCPFAHLSNNLAPAKEALLIFTNIVKQLNDANVSLIEGHFGSDKEMLMHLHGHPGNARYREF